MKKHILIVGLALISIVGFTQQVSIAAKEFNILNVGFDNPLKIVVANCDPKSIIVKTDNGVIVGENGEYISRPKKLGLTHFTVYKKKNGMLKKVGVVIFRAKDIGETTVMLGGRKGGYFQKNMMIAMGGLVAYIGYCSNFRLIIDSFTFSIVRANTCLIQEIKNVGAQFNNEVKDAISKTEEGDQVIFKFIYAKFNDGSSQLLMPLIFQISDKKEKTSSN